MLLVLLMSRSSLLYCCVLRCIAEKIHPNNNHELFITLLLIFIEIKALVKLMIYIINQSVIFFLFPLSELCCNVETGELINFSHSFRYICIQVCCYPFTCFVDEKIALYSFLSNVLRQWWWLSILEFFAPEDYERKKSC